MHPIDAILAALDEREIARNVRLHDEARIRFPFSQITVPPHLYHRLITEYAYFHFHYTIRASNLPAFDRIEEHHQLQFLSMAEKQLRRQARSRDDEDSFLIRCARNAVTGENGGAKKVLDLIAQGFREEAVDLYVSCVLAKYVVSYRDQTALVGQLFQVCDPAFAALFDRSRPDAYGQDYKRIILSYVEWKRGQRDILRRLNPG